MYVLPYGQMSLWGATVITNLLSAIPIFGPDLVELIWGGLYTNEPYYGDVILKILLNAGISPNLKIAYDLFLIIIINVKIAIIWRKSAGVRSLHTSEASQRLYAEDLIKIINKKYIHKNAFNLINLKPYYITGFSDGESTFHVSVLKNKEYKIGYHILPVFSIQLHIKDIFLLERIKDYFNTGTVRIKKNKDNTTAIYSVQSYKDILNIIIPHFDKYL